eukprot:scaffold868_cov249-Pinguiococcus_pyrenoidosus.AAC.6
MIWNVTGRNFVSLPLVVYYLHLSIGDAWNNLYTVRPAGSRVLSRTFWRLSHLLFTGAKAVGSGRFLHLVRLGFGARPHRRLLQDAPCCWVHHRSVCGVALHRFAVGDADLGAESKGAAGAHSAINLGKRRGEAVRPKTNGGTNDATGLIFLHAKLALLSFATFGISPKRARSKDTEYIQRLTCW